MERGPLRTFLAAIMVIVGIFAGFFLWSQGSAFTYAAAIPVLAGAFLAVRSGDANAPWPRLALATLALGWLLLGLSFLAGAGSPRSLLFFVLLPGSVGFLLLGALLDPRRWPVAVAGLLGVFLVVRWSSYHAFATFGGNDSFFHVGAAEYIVRHGSVAGSEIADKYTLTPGMHLVGAMTKLSTGLTIGDAMFWSIVVVQLAIPLGLLTLARRHGQGFAGAAVVAIVALDATFISSSVNFQPGALTLALAIPILLVLGHDDLRSFALFVLAAIAMLFVHQLSTFVVMVVAVSYAGALLVLGRFRLAASAQAFLKATFFVLGFFLVNVVLASLFGLDYIDRAIDQFVNVFEPAEVGSVDQVSRVSGSTRTNFLFKATLVVCSAVAIAAAARLFVERNARTAALGFAGLAILALAFGLPLTGIDLIAERWIPIAVVTGLAGAGQLMWRWSLPSQAGLTLLLVGVAVFGITQPVVAHDHVFYAADRNVENQFNEPDLVTAALLVDQEVRIFTDVGMLAALRSHEFDYKAFPIRQLATTQVNGTVHVTALSLVILRDDLLEQQRLHFSGPGRVGFVLPDTPPERFQAAMDREARILDVGGITAFYT